MEIHVGMGQIKVTQPPDLLLAVGLGSCVAVILHDQETQIGGLAHVVLPHLREAHNKSHPTKFSDVAIGQMIDRMVKQGARVRNIKAKIFGGANMFPQIIAGNSSMNVGKRNILSVIEELEKHGIPILAQEVGDHIGRTVLFDSRDGSAVVKTAHFEKRRY
jgi:chemotaxis protein CheD